LANRIYIAIGLLAILLMGAAFIVPHFMNWDAYKPRMEALASEALGIEVSIAGDMGFTLLPQPQLRIADIRLGPPDNPLGRAQQVQANFSLMDFLRDRYMVTDLALTGPELNLTINEQGQLETPIVLADNAIASNVSIAHARFSEGVFAVTDQRSGNSWSAVEIDGDMRMNALRGPFTVQAQGLYEGGRYSARIGTSAMNPEGAMQITAGLRPESGTYSVTIEGLLRTGAAPDFDGALTYRQSQRHLVDADAGDLVLTSPMQADGERVLLSDFTLMPDEDQVATRLTGSASISLGATPSFEASVSGGVVPLLPRVIEDDGEGQPFALLKLLREMPEPMMPAMPGRISMEISELGLRNVSLREVRLDAQSDGAIWNVDRLSGRMAGDTIMNLSGQLGRAAGWPAFDGQISASAERLDALSALWRRASEGNPLFGMAGGLEGRLQLSNEHLRISDAIFTLDGTNHSGSLHIRFGERSGVDVSARLSEMTTRQSQALLAFLPVLDGGGRFGASFPEGRLDLVAAAGSFAGQRFRDLSLVSSWDADGLRVDGLAVQDFGGAAFEGSALVSGTLNAPVLSGSGTVHVRRNAALLDLMFGPAGPENRLRQLAQINLPVEMKLDLDAPRQDGGQTVSFEGRAGQVDLWLTADIAGGAFAFGNGHATLALEAVADSGVDLLEQFGMAPIIAGEDGAILNLYAYGNPSSRMEAEVTVEGGGERIDFSGSLNLADLAAIQGQGQTSFLLLDSVALMDMSGATGVYFPGLEGQADVGFVGNQSVTLSNIAAFAGDRQVTGELSYAAQTRSATVGGALAFDAMDVQTLGAMLGGPASMLQLETDVWPDGPFDIGASQRRTRGRIAIQTPVVFNGEVEVLRDTQFDFAWDHEDVRIRSLQAQLGTGTLTLEAGLCCASQLADKSLTGRFAIEGVDLEALLPSDTANIVSGILNAGGQFQANGDSFAAMADALTGDGSFTISQVRAERFSPAVFASAASIDNLVELDPETLEMLVLTALDSGPFLAEEAGGLFVIAGGNLRVSNIAMDGRNARLLGSGQIDIAQLMINGGWTLASTQNHGGNGLITETTGRIGVNVTGPLDAPERELDLTQMVDAIQMRAYELELEELERLRAEQEARQRAAAEEQARMMEEEARRQTEELLRQQREEAERLEMEERLRFIEELEQQLQDASSQAQDAAEPDTQAAPAPVVPLVPPLILPPGTPGSSIFMLPPSEPAENL